MECVGGEGSEYSILSFHKIFLRGIFKNTGFRVAGLGGSVGNILWLEQKVYNKYEMRQKCNRQIIKRHMYYIKGIIYMRVFVYVRFYSIHAFLL